MRERLKHFDKFFVVYFKFDLKSFSEKMRAKHENWSSKMCHNSRYYNRTIQNGLDLEISGANFRLKKHLKDKKVNILTLRGGTCRICTRKRIGKCAFPDKCRFPHLVRYSMEAVGIDVTSTMRNIGIVLEWPPKKFVYQVGLICVRINREVKLGTEFFENVWWKEECDGYHAICRYDGRMFQRCPNNEKGLCKSATPCVPKHLCHEPDAKNNWKCPCG